MLADFVTRFPKLRLAVIGDSMLDRYVYGLKLRLNPESSSHLLTADNRVEDRRLGGAGNVAANVQTLGAKVDLYTALGKDEAGAQVRTLLKQIGVRLFAVECGQTIVKVRFIDREHNHPLLRVDYGEMPLLKFETKHQRKVLMLLRKHISSYDAVIISDYNKMIFKGRLGQEIISLAKRNGVPTFVDPKPSNALSFRGSFLIRPNLIEARNIVGKSLSPAQLAKRLKEKMLATYTVVTCGSRGMYVSGPWSGHVPARLKPVSDVTGAGDTVISCLALAFTAGASMEEAANIASIAASIVVGKVGAATVSPQELIDELSI